MKKIFIVGPTASGKSSLAHELALKIGGEIICADSQTIRKDLDIGTAKPTKAEREEVPYHLLDIIEPYDSFSVAEYVRLAQQAIDECITRGKTPIIVGGTGLYVDALFFGFSFNKHNQHDRDKLQKKSVKELHSIIEKKGYPFPENTQNPRHLIGMILRQGALPVDQEPIEGAVMFGIQTSDNVLKQRIHDRVSEMFDAGFLEEAQAVFKKYGKPQKKMDAIGYPIALRHLTGEISKQEAQDLFRQADWQYARRQKSWLRRNKYITWLSNENSKLDQILETL